MESQLQLFKSDHPEPWTVRVSQRARRLSVRVYPGGRVEVVVPRGASAASVQRFVGTHRRWILDRVDELSTTQQPGLSRAYELRLPYVDKCIPIEYHARGSSRPQVTLSQYGVLHVHGAIQDDKQVAQTLRHWLMSEAHAALGAHLATLAQEMEFTYRRVQIRRQRTRWGSCSASGTISLNVCLMFLQPQIVRYLLVHELCHTRHMNHSGRFWTLVESLEPGYRQLDRELLRGWQHVPAWMFM